jgi:competence ComEA-like helix-hairpin-helix protein
LTSVLFVTSNGTGLGHLTRCMAIARRLPHDLTPIILTLSKALPTVREQGFYAEYFPSSAHAGFSVSRWNVLFALRLSALLDEYDPSVVAFDGAYPYTGLRTALEMDGRATSVWIRRPMWQPARSKALSFSAAFDEVLEPGEFAAEVDEGPTVDLREEAITVDPIVFCDESDLLTRRQAEEQLGLEPGRTHVLIQLGEVPTEQGDPLMRECATRILREPDTQIVVLESAISETLVLPEEVIKLSATYPIARFYRAFDFVISAAGYNSYHELICFQIPAGFFPVPKETDNQAARARYAHEAGVGVDLGADGNQGIEELLNKAGRRRMTARARELRFPNGAVAAAEAIASLALASEPGRGRLRSRRRFRRPRPSHSAVAARPGLATSTRGGLISLRVATVEQLGGIEGIGSVTARKIIEFRDRHGRLSSIEELAEIGGVGPATMEALRGHLRP